MPGHDLRYAIDAGRLRTELGWTPRYGSFRDGLAATVDWYRDNEPWWRPQKDATEASTRAPSGSSPADARWFVAGAAGMLGQDLGTVLEDAGHG